MNPIRYIDGTDARIGDAVDLDGIPSVVEDVIDSPEKMAHWGLVHRGLMLRNEQLGRVFQPVDSVEWDACLFVKRGEAPGH